MKKIKGKIELPLSIVFLIVSVIGIFITFYKSEIDINYLKILVGIIGSVLGVVLSILFIKINKKKPLSKVFIAYAYNDKETADIIYSSLNENNIKVIREDDEIEIGIDLTKQLVSTISNVDIVLIILSKDYYKSKNLKNIIDLSKSLKKRILPITTDNSSIPNSLSNLKYIDTSENSDRAINEIIQNVLHA